VKHTIRIVHERGEDGQDPGLWEIVKEVTIEDAEVRSLRWWVHENLRRDPANIVHQIFPVLSSAVWWQAWEQGNTDALALGESRLAESANPLWRDGYESGFAIGMSQRADEADEREGRT
jgi:hypothetical protein